MGTDVGVAGKVIEYEPYKRWRLIVDARSVSTDEKLTFDAVESSTRVTIVYDVKVSGLLKLFSSRIDRALRKRWKLGLISLKNILEA